MTGGCSQAARLVRAPRARVFQAFVKADELLAWLPPAELTGTLHAFDPRPGGGYEMSLFYPESETVFRGKTAEREDRVKVRYLELLPGARIVQAVRFVSDDPAFGGETRLVVTFADRLGGTEVVMCFENLPPGVRPQDNDEGARLSLEQLARFLENAGP